MTAWVLVGVAGGVLSLLGFLGLVRRYRRGETTWRYLAAAGVGFVAFASFVLLSAAIPDFAGGPAGLITLLVASVALVLVIREHQKSNGAQ